MELKWMFVKSLQLFADGAGDGTSDAPGEDGQEAAVSDQQDGQCASGEADQPQDAPPAPRDAYASRQMQHWIRQAEQARQFFPGLDLEAEAKDPRFRQLLDAGVDVESAYVALHRDEIIPTLVHRAARMARQRLASSIMAGSARPAENGLTGQSSAVSKSDVSRLSRQQRDEIRRRAARGERVTF